MTRALALTLGLVGVTLGALASPALAAPPVDLPGGRTALDAAKVACAKAYEQGQELRASGHLKAAREQLLTCSAPACPKEMQGECATWGREIDAAMPTVVVVVTAAVGSAVGARVTVDGREVTSGVVDGRPSGAPIPLDPGPHTLRAELPQRAPIERVVTLAAGAHERVELVFSAASVSSTRPAWPMFALGGLGAAGLVSFAAFGLAGASSYGDLKDTCAPNCTSAQSSSVATKLLVADVSLGVGLAALAGAAVLFVTRPKAPPPVALSARGVAIAF